MLTKKLFPTSLLLLSLLSTSILHISDASRFGSNSADPICETFGTDTRVAGNLIDSVPTCHPLVVEQDNNNNNNNDDRKNVVAVVGQVCVETEAFLPDTARDMLKITFDITYLPSDYFLGDIAAQVVAVAGDDGEEETKASSSSSSSSQKETLGESSSSDSTQIFSLYMPLVQMQGQCCYGSEYDKKSWRMISNATVYRKQQQQGQRQPIVVTTTRVGEEAVTFETTCRRSGEVAFDSIAASFASTSNETRGINVHSASLLSSPEKEVDVNTTFSAPPLSFIPMSLTPIMYLQS